MLSLQAAQHTGPTLEKREISTDGLRKQPLTSRFELTDMLLVDV